MEKIIKIERSGHMMLVMKEFVIPDRDNIFSVELWDETFFYDEGSILKRHEVAYILEFAERVWREIYEEEGF